jgi:hypothetical protein
MHLCAYAPHFCAALPHGLPAVSAVVGAATELVAAGLELRALSQLTFAWKFPSIINARRVLHNCKVLHD